MSKRASQPAYFWATMLAVVVGVAATFWAYLHLGYQLGLAGKFSSGTGHAAQGYDRLSDWITNRRPPYRQTSARTPQKALTIVWPRWKFVCTSSGESS